MYFQFNTEGNEDCTACEVRSCSTWNIIDCYYFVRKDKIPVSLISSYIIQLKSKGHVDDYDILATLK